jgi:hypothetical protein
MREANDIASTNRHRSIPYFKWFSWLVLSTLIPSVASAGVGFLQISRPETGHYDKGPAFIATGVPYRVVVHKTSIMPGVGIVGSGKIALPVVGVATYTDREFKTVDAKVDDPSIVEIVGREGNVITLRGKVPGFTTLRVKARTKLGIIQTAHASVGSVVPSGVQLTTKCDDYRAEGQKPVLAAINGELTLAEELYSDKIPVLSNSFPPISFGALIPVPSKDGQETGKSDYVGGYFVRVKAPATAMTTSLKVPAFGYELPVQVYEPSAVSDIRVILPKKSCLTCPPGYIEMEVLVGGRVPCVKPVIPVEVTIGPTSVCGVASGGFGNRTMNGDHEVYELPVFKPLKISWGGAGTCVVNVEAKGIAKSATAQVVVPK